MRELFFIIPQITAKNTRFLFFYYVFITLFVPQSLDNTGFLFQALPHMGQKKRGLDDPRLLHRKKKLFLFHQIAANGNKQLQNSLVIDRARLDQNLHGVARIVKRVHHDSCFIQRFRVSQSGHLPLYYSLVFLDSQFPHGFIFNHDMGAVRENIVPRSFALNGLSCGYDLSARILANAHNDNFFDFAFLLFH